MNISLNWLRDFIDWTGSAAELDELLTRAGIKVESIHEKGAEFPKYRRRADPRIQPASECGPPERLPG